MTTIFFGYLLDMIFGDPIQIPHPVRWIGKLIEKQEKYFKKFPLTSLGLRVSGFVIVVVTVGVSFFIPLAILKISYLISPILGKIIEIFMIFQILATCSLGDEADKIYKLLRKGNVEGARKQISMLVSRDTNNMSQENICKATIETVAENFADGVISPLFYVFIGGPALGWAYKSINTLDSMLGYKSDKYIDLGRYSAKLDDIVNWIPARLSVIFIWIASSLMKLNTKSSIEMVRRDHDKHSSPNSAWPESAFAGALGIQLGGEASYFGIVENKPTIGDSVRNIDYTLIRESVQLMYYSSFGGLIILSLVKLLSSGIS